VPTGSAVLDLDKASQRPDLPLRTHLVVLISRYREPHLGHPKSLLRGGLGVDEHVELAGHRITAFDALTHLLHGVINQRTELAAGLHQELLGRVDVADRGLEQLDCEFLGSWGIHLLVICADIYLIYAGGCGSGGGSYRMVVVVTLLRAAVTFTVNAIVKADYAFSTESPPP
jgi:hypothetical protein